MTDPVNHPDHYTRGPCECIEAIEGLGLDYHTGNALKYIWRAGHKRSAGLVQDLEKAIWYLKRRVEVIKERQEIGFHRMPGGIMPAQDVEKLLDDCAENAKPFDEDAVQRILAGIREGKRRFEAKKNQGNEPEKRETDEINAEKTETPEGSNEINTKQHVKTEK